METVGGEVVGKKGPVFTTAIIAGVQAAKRTSDLVPFCHPLPIEDCRVELNLTEGGKVRAVPECTWSTASSAVLVTTIGFLQEGYCMGVFIWTSV